MASFSDIRSQLLVHYPDDANGSFWHHRTLPYRVGSDATWICLTPDHELMCLDLGELRLRAVGRCCFLPAARNAFEIYVFDRVSTADMEQFRRDTMLLLAAEDETVVDRELWVISGPLEVVGDDRTGITIALGVQDDAEGFREPGNPAVAEMDGIMVSTQRVSEDRLVSWTADLQAFGRDDGTLPVVVRNGRRYQDLPSCFIQEWTRIGVEFDMPDASNRALAEILLRSQAQLEIAVGRDAMHPDLSGGSEASGGTSTDFGIATVAKFREFLAGRQKDRANVLKNARLARYERDSFIRHFNEARPEPPAMGAPKGGANKYRKAKEETEDE